MNDTPAAASDAKESLPNISTLGFLKSQHTELPKTPKPFFIYILSLRILEIIIYKWLAARSFSNSKENFSDNGLIMYDSKASLNSSLVRLQPFFSGAEAKRQRRSKRKKKSTALWPEDIDWVSNISEWTIIDVAAVCLGLSLCRPAWHDRYGRSRKNENKEKNIFRKFATMHICYSRFFSQKP